MTLLNWVTLSASIPILYAAACLYETEDGRIQSILEKAWVRVDDVGRSAERMHKTLLQRLAEALAWFSARCFGPKLVSAYALESSVGLTVGWILFMSSLIVFTGPILGIEFGGPIWVLWLGGSVGALSLGAVVCRGIRRTRWVTVWSRVVILLAVFEILLLALMFGKPAAKIAIVAGIAMSVASDFVFVSSSRALFRYASHTRTAAIVLSIVGYLTLAMILSSAPNAVAVELTMRQIEASPQRYYRPTPVILFFSMWSGGNTHIFVLALIVVLFGLFVLLDRAFWRLASRLSYQPVRHRLATNKPLLWALGIGLLAASLPPSVEVGRGLLSRLWQESQALVR